MAKKKRVILIIEDDPTQLHALATTFQKEGYAVHTAENGHEGFEAAIVKIPDVIVLDIIMPVMNGIAALEKINGNEATRAIPVIILTNFALYEEVRPFMNLAKDHFLTKTNTSLKDIITKVNDVLS